MNAPTRGRLDVDRALEVAERALLLCRGDYAQVIVDEERSLVHRFANSQLVQSTDVDEVRVEVLVSRNGARSTASTLDTGRAGLAEVAARAGRRAEQTAAAGAAGAGAVVVDHHPTRLISEAGFDTETAELDAGRGHAALATAVGRCDQVGGSVFGLWTVAATGLAVADSVGLRAYQRRTDARMKCVCRVGIRSGFAAGAAGSVGRIDAHGLADVAAVDAAVPVRALEIGQIGKSVVLTSCATAFLLAMLGPIAANGLADTEGRGTFSHRHGERIASPAITLIDDPMNGGTLPRAFDLEGTQASPVTLIDRGVVSGVVHDRRSAARSGAISTGHAAAPGGDLEGPVAANLSLAAGQVADLEGLVADVEAGLLVTRFWYGDVLDAREAVVTAMTRDGLFAIERGKIVGSLPPMRLTDSILTMLASVDALTKRRELIGEEHLIGRRMGQNGVLAPAIRAHRAGLSVSK